MALIRMRESICMNSSYYTDITKTAPESIKESLKSLPNERLNESVIDDSIKSAIVQMKEAKTVSDTIVDNVVTKLRERGVSLNERKIYRVPVGRWDNVNGNRRIYTKKLWENVMNNQQDAWKGLCGLADHPTEDNDPGSIKNSSIVWLGMELDDLEKIVYGIGTFVGPLGHMFQEIIDAGGRVGFSSSGFGEMMPDGQTVNPDTYQIERLADVVLNPSQDVYGVTEDEANGLGNIEYTKQQAVIEESVKPTSNLKESTNMEEKKSILSKVEEKAFRNYVKAFIEDTNNMKSPKEQLKELQNINEMFEEGVAPDLKAQLEERIANKQAELENLLESAINMKEELGVESLEDITEGTKKVIEEGSALAEQVTNYKSLVEGLTSRNRDLAAQVTVLTDGIRKANTAKEFAINEATSLKKRVSSLSLKATVNEAKLAESGDKLSESSQFTEETVNEVRQLRSLLSEAESRNARLEKALKSNRRMTESNLRSNDSENANLKEALDKANLKLEIREARAERNSMKHDAELVKTQESLDRALAEAQEREHEIKRSANAKIHALTERLNKYRSGNEKLERANSILESKVRNANSMLSNLSNKNAALKESLHSDAHDNQFIKNIKESVARLNEEGTCEFKIDDNGNMIMTALNVESEPAVPPLESPEITVMNDMKGPAIEDDMDELGESAQIGKYMDFRDQLPIEKYWADQYSQFGEALMPYEHKIRDAKTLSEAQREFFKALPFISGKINEARINPKAIRQERLDESKINLKPTKTPSQSMAEKFGLL